jgi:hypothetical protein
VRPGVDASATRQASSIKAFPRRVRYSLPTIVDTNERATCGRRVLLARER